jgi:hypothetical protein
VAKGPPADVPSASTRIAAKIAGMTAKELLLKRAPTLTEEEAERALHALDGEPLSTIEDEPGDADVVGLPERWMTFEDGTPQPNWVAAIRRSRSQH